MSDRPGVLDGVIGGFKEFLLRFRATKECPECGASWTGHYPKEYMDYCHHCGSELVDPRRKN